MKKKWEDLSVFGKIKVYFKLTWRRLQQLPHKKAWFALTIASVLLFGWHDELLIWSISVWTGWWLPVVYYGIEFGVMLPATYYLAKKTAEELPSVNEGRLKRGMLASFKQSLPIIAGFTAIRIIGLVWIPYMLKWWIQILPVVPYLCYFVYKLKQAKKKERK